MSILDIYNTLLVNIYDNTIPLSITITGNNKIYDGTTIATVSLTGSVSNYILTSTPYFSDIIVNTNKIIKCNLMSSGLYYIYYSTYFSDNPLAFFSMSRQTGLNNVSSGISTNFNSLDTATNNNISSNIQINAVSLEWTGNFFTGSNSSGVWTFNTSSDDASYLWLGSTALLGNYTVANALVNNSGIHNMVVKTGTINLTTNTYYPIRIQYGQGNGGYGLQVFFTTPSNVTYYDGTGFYFNNNTYQTTGNITQKYLTAISNSKTYDGTTIATVSLSGLVSNDLISISSFYTDVNVGTNKLVLLPFAVKYFGVIFPVV